MEHVRHLVSSAEIGAKTKKAVPPSFGFLSSFTDAPTPRRDAVTSEAVGSALFGSYGKRREKVEVASEPEQTLCLQLTSPSHVVRSTLLIKIWSQFLFKLAFISRSKLNSVKPVVDEWLLCSYFIHLSLTLLE